MDFGKERPIVADGSLAGPFDSIFDGLVLTDAATRTFSDCNLSFCRMLEYPKESIVGQSIFRFHPAEAHASVERAFEDLVDGRIDVARDVPVETKSGRILYFDIATKGVDFRGRPHLFGVFHDVTDRLRTENELRKEESLLMGIYDSTPAGLCLVSDRTFIKVNRTLCSITGYSDAELIGNSTRMLYPDSGEFERVGRDIYGRLSSERQSSTETRLRRKDGRPMDALLYASPIDPADPIAGIALTILDITERKKSEAALMESEAKYRALVDNMQEAVFRCDQSGTILYASPSAARMLGCVSSDSMAGLGLRRDFGLSGSDGGDVIEALGASGKLTRFEAGLRRRDDGRAVDVLMDCQFFRDREGGIVGFECVCADVTEQKRMEADRAKLEQMFLQSQRMESIGRLAGGVAHDFNNLLTAIIGNTDMAMDLLERDGKPRAMLAQALKAAEGAANLTKQLLAFSRKQVVELRTLDLNEVIEGVKKMISSLLGENVEFGFKPSYSIHRIKADQGQLEQVIMNLAVNARDAMPAGGRLSITTRNASLFESDCRGLGGLEPGDYASMVVSDTGSGMTKEIMDHLFEPFFTTKAKGGSGLGLSTVYGIVKQFGGGVSVQSEVGKGTTFTFYLPASPDEAASARDAVAKGDSPRGSETILMVEDNAQVLEFGRDALMGLGYTVMTAVTGEEGAAIAGAYEGPIDLLFTDIILPGMNGRQTAQRISRERPGMKTIYTSGYTAEVIDTQGILEEGLNFLPKPFNSRDLALKVRSVLDGA